MLPPFMAHGLNSQLALAKSILKPNKDKMTTDRRLNIKIFKNMDKVKNFQTFNIIKIKKQNLYNAQ